VTLSRESYNWDVDREMNRALDWLKSEGVRRVIVTGDFHLSTQMVGADTSDFFPTLSDVNAGLAITRGWSATARRLHDEFESSVAFVGGKRCLGGMLEMAMHCHYVVAVEDARFGWPEVALPVVPGMEACHWPFRRASREHWPRIAHLLLSGEPVRAKDAVGWLIDAAQPMETAIRTAWSLASGSEASVKRRGFEAGKLDGAPAEVAGLSPADGPATVAARAAISQCIARSCGVPAHEAIEVQAKLAAEFLASPACREGRVGAEFSRTMSA
jgi:enoyl-CoA hydratase/carnithine racemase